MSMGFLVPASEAVVWRGPMLHKAIQQFLGGVNWGEFDYLIVDMPPGTGDVALSLSQSVPLTGAVVVCTPQDVALIDAVKAITMFKKVNIPILGIVENMSYFLCPDNGKRYDIFGHGGAQRKAQELAAPFLGEVPINIQLRINGDEGRTGEQLRRRRFGTVPEPVVLSAGEEPKRAAQGEAATADVVDSVVAWVLTNASEFATQFSIEKHHRPGSLPAGGVLYSIRLRWSLTRRSVRSLWTRCAVFGE